MRVSRGSKAAIGSLVYLEFESVIKEIITPTAVAIGLLEEVQSTQKVETSLSRRQLSSLFFSLRVIFLQVESKFPAALSQLGGKGKQSLASPVCLIE